MQGALIPGPLSSARCSGPLFHVSSQASAVNAHITFQDPSSKLSQQHSCSPQSESGSPPAVHPAVSSGPGYLNPRGDQYKATSHSRTQSNSSHEFSSRFFWGQTSKTFSNHTNTPHSVHHLQCLKHFTFLRRPGPAPCAQTRQTPHKLKPYKLARADLQMHLREGLGRAPTVIFSLMSRATPSFWVQYSWITPKNALKLLKSYAMSPVVSEE